jgi:hypothetical protein
MASAIIQYLLVSAPRDGLTNPLFGPHFKKTNPGQGTQQSGGWGLGSTRLHRWKLGALSPCNCCQLSILSIHKVNTRIWVLKPLLHLDDYLGMVILNTFLSRVAFMLDTGTPPVPAL